MKTAKILQPLMRPPKKFVAKKIEKKHNGEKNGYLAKFSEDCSFMTNSSEKEYTPKTKPTPTQ